MGSHKHKQGLLEVEDAPVLRRATFNEKWFHWTLFLIVRFNCNLQDMIRVVKGVGILIFKFLLEKLIKNWKEVYLQSAYLSDNFKYQIWYLWWTLSYA